AQLRGEQNLHVIDSLSGHLRAAEDALVSSDKQSKYDAFVRRQFGQAAEQVGWDPKPSDSDETKALRASLLEIMGSAEDQQAITLARKLVDQYMADPGSVDGTVIGDAFTVSASHGDEALYVRFTDELSKAKSTDEYYHYLYALADFHQPELLERSIALVDTGKVRQQDYPRFFSALLSNDAARDAAWKYLKGHWSDLAAKVTSFGGAGAISALGNACTLEMHDDVQQFFQTHPAPGAQRAVKQSLQRIQDCVAFKREQQQSMEQWLSRQ